MEKRKKNDAKTVIFRVSIQNTYYCNYIIGQLRINSVEKGQFYNSR